MEIDSRTIEQYLGQAEFMIPAYQRPYQWSDDLLEGLWSDLGELYLGTNTKDHYIGVLLSIAETAPRDMLRGAKPTSVGRTVWSLVDGQQRLVTILLLLAAIRDTGTSSTARNAAALITAPRKNPRLLGQEEDRGLLTRILTTPKPALSKQEDKTRVGHTYGFFLRQIASGTKSFWNPVAVTKPMTNGSKRSDLHPSKLLTVVTSRLTLTDMMLGSSGQSAPAVFDAINGKRRELEPVDLLRNTVFAELDDVTHFTQTWAKIEKEARAVRVGSARLGTLPLFIDSYLHSIGESASQHRLARRLNELILADAPMSLGKKKRRTRVKALVDDVVTSFSDFKVAQSSAFGGFARTYPAEAVRAFDNISMLSSGPPLPLSLLFLRWHRKNFITGAQLIALAETLESYLGRRLICGYPQQLMRSHLTSVTGKMIREFGNHSGVAAKTGSKSAAQALSELQSALVTGTSPAPKDPELRTEAARRTDLNKLSARQRFAVLRRLNDSIAGRHIADVTLSTDPKGPVNFSIEHVFPQSFKTRADLTKEWSDELAAAGMKARDIDDLIKLRDNLGNYALAHQNRALGRRAFLDNKPARGRVRLGKRSMLSDRALDINSSVLRTTTASAGARRVWDAAAIRQRAGYLADQLATAYRPL